MCIVIIFELNKKQIQWVKNKFGVSDYTIAWIAFIKGLIVGSLITFYFVI